jgi:hypothetical protein
VDCYSHALTRSRFSTLCNPPSLFSCAILWLRAGHQGIRIRLLHSKLNPTPSSFTLRLGCPTTDYAPPWHRSHRDELEDSPEQVFWNVHCLHSKYESHSHLLNIYSLLTASHNFLHIISCSKYDYTGSVPPYNARLRRNSVDALD